MKRNLAFFDVDKTIFDGYSGSGILPFLEQIGFLKKGTIEWYRDIEEQYKKREIDYNDIAYGVIQTLATSFAGHPHERVLALMEEYLGREYVYPWVAQLIGSLHQAVFDTILVSGSTQPFIDAICKKIGARAGFGSEIEINDGVYTGKLLKMLNHNEKQRLVDLLIKEYNPQIVLAFGDSTGDIPMLERAAYAFIYEPHQQEMIKIAESKSNWFIVKRKTILDTVVSVLSKYER